MSSSDAATRERHWVRTRNLTYIVLVLWVIFAIIVPWLAGPLNAYTFLGFPLGYYMCVQGSLIAFVVLIWVQNWYQDKIDDDAGYSE